MFCCVVCVYFIYFRAVKVNALFYDIILAEINAIKYLNAVNATFVYFRCALTHGTKPPRVCSQLDRRDRDGSGRWRELRDCWAESFCLRGKMTEQPTKLKSYVAFVKLNLAITEAARLAGITSMHITRQKAVPG